MNYRLSKSSYGQSSQGESDASNDPTLFRKAKPQRSNLVKFLEEVGYEDIFDTSEVKEINDMLNVNPITMSKSELVLDSIKVFENEQQKSNSQDISALEIAQKDSKSTSEINVYSFKSHLDKVNSGIFIPNSDIAATVSDDCTVRLWDLKLLDQQDKQKYEDIRYNFNDDGSEFVGSPYEIYSYYTLKGHTGTVTKIDSNHETSDHKLIYTAGVEGVIRVWRVPERSEINQISQDSNLCVYTWEAHPNEVIWDIKHHLTEPYILSVGADEMVALWKTPSQNEIEQMLEDQNDNKRLEDKLFINSFEFNENQAGDIPTC